MSLSSTNPTTGLLGALLVAVLATASGTTVNFNNLGGYSRLYQIESAIDGFRLLDALAKISEFIKMRSSDPSRFEMSIGIREIELKMAGRVLVKAEQDFFNKNSWKLAVCEELRNAVQQTKLF